MGSAQKTEEAEYDEEEDEEGEIAALMGEGAWYTAMLSSVRAPHNEWHSLDQVIDQSRCDFLERKKS